MTSRIVVVSIAVFICACSPGSTLLVRDTSGQRYHVKRMPDGIEWTVENINVNLPSSLCYDNNATNCQRYGRLYFWDDAISMCKQLGDDWRLPTKDEWQRLAKHFGGAFNDSSNGKDAYIALTAGGASQFNALLSGGGDRNNSFRNVEAHGFYWTATEVNDSIAYFANFGKGRPALFLQNDGEKYNAFAVRCVKDP